MRLLAILMLLVPGFCLLVTMFTVCPSLAYLFYGKISNIYHGYQIWFPAVK